MNSDRRQGEEEHKLYNLESGERNPTEYDGAILISVVCGLWNPISLSAMHLVWAQALQLAAVMKECEKWRKTSRSQ